MKPFVVTIGLALALAGAGGAATALLMPRAALAQTTTDNVTATDGDASALGTGNASAAPGSVTRGDSPGTSLLGPDGTYNVVDVAPPNISVTGDTAVAKIILDYPSLGSKILVKLVSLLSARLRQTSSKLLQYMERSVV